MNHIVLGYDGSDFPMQVLDWALDEADLYEGPAAERLVALSCSADHADTLCSATLVRPAGPQRPRRLREGVGGVGHATLDSGAFQVLHAPGVPLV
jgi:hypothetical protein